MVFSIPQILVINPTLPVKSMEQLVSHAKANPGKISFAIPGYGTQPHLLGEMLKLMTGINIVHVPYKGPTQAITDLLSGQVQMYFDTVALFLPHIEAGKLTALAVADETRSPQLPAVPTTAESGFATLQSTFWAGVVAPAGTSPSIVSKLNAGDQRNPKIPGAGGQFSQDQRKAENWFTRRLRCVYGCGDAEMDESHKFGRHQSRLIPNCSDPQNYQPSSTSRADRLGLGQVGKLAPFFAL